MDLPTSPQELAEERQVRPDRSAPDADMVGGSSPSGPQGGEASFSTPRVDQGPPVRNPFEEDDSGSNQGGTLAVEQDVPSFTTVQDERRNRSTPAEDANSPAEDNDGDQLSEWEQPASDDAHEFKVRYAELSTAHKRKRTTLLKKRAKEAGASTPVAPVTGKQRKRRGAAEGATPAGPSKKIKRVTQPKTPGGKKTGSKKAALTKESAIKLARRRLDAGGQESDFEEDMRRANALDATEEDPFNPRLVPEEPETPTVKTKGKKRAKNGKKESAEELEAASVSGPFGGVVKVLKGDDVEALIARSMQAPTREMLAFRKRIWDMCERCARYIRRGRSTHPSLVRYLWTNFSTGMTCINGNMSIKLKKRCTRCSNIKDFCRSHRWIPEATKPFNLAIIAFQSWETASRNGDDVVTVQAYRDFVVADKNWVSVLASMQLNSNRVVGDQATPHKNKGSSSGGSDGTLALPHLQSIAASLQSLVDLQCLVGNTSEAHA